MFLNKVEGYSDLYRQSSVLYSIVPFKKELSILFVDIKEDGYKIAVSDEFDYIVKTIDTYKIESLNDKEKKLLCLLTIIGRDIKRYGKQHKTI